MRTRTLFLPVAIAAIVACAIGATSGVVPTSALAAEAARASAGDEATMVAPASTRFAAAETQETPDFQRHVSPLLGRLGCNGRVCHGSFQGQGGFQLSLFGYDFAADHRALVQQVGDEGVPRVATDQPTDSLLIAKPTLAVPHEGGQRLEPDGWQYRLLLRWIESGAPGTSAAAPLRRLQSEPAELVLRDGQQRPLRIIADWDDGSREDVTCLARFQSADTAVAEVSPAGEVTVTGQGDTHVVVYYDNGVMTVPVLVPRDGDRQEPPAAEPVEADATEVDRLIAAKLNKLGLRPSAICDDTQFLRRLSLDLTGTLPTPDEIDRFCADRSPDKRRRKIDQLLQTPAYAAWWANWLSDFTGNSSLRQSDGSIRYQISAQWRQWLHRRVAENMPYDQIVAGIVLAVGRDAGQTYAEYTAQMSRFLRDGGEVEFASRQTMPHYWTRENVRQPEEKGLAVAHSFLGIRLQCAQCHKHPFDRWTQSDFQQFARFFDSVAHGVAADSRPAMAEIATSAGQTVDADKLEAVSTEAAARAEGGATIAFRELYVDHDRLPKGQLQLLGSTVSMDGRTDPRAALMQWMRQPQNPYFARALVNRVWAVYFHAGLIEPVDDLNLANPPSNGPLLDYLCQGFVGSGYDLHWLHREIAGSLAYQRDWRPNETNADDRRNFSRFIPRRLHAEVLYDAWKQATASTAELTEVRENLDRRSVGNLATRMAGTYAQRVFGQPDRLLACDCERSNTPSLLQAVFVQNDPLVHARLNESGWIAEIAPQLSERSDRRLREDVVRQAYLRTVSRPPTAAERSTALQYLDDSPSPEEGLRDLMWALLCSKEFLLNH